MSKKRTNSKIQNILIAQSVPKGGGSSYKRLAEKFGVTVTFQPFVKVSPIQGKKFLKQKINILDYSAIIFTSRNAVDHFFRVCVELKLEMPINMKYFCVSAQTANYLQKYVMRKRTVYAGMKAGNDLTAIMKKHKKEKYLIPCSEGYKTHIIKFLQSNEFSHTKAIMYETLPEDLACIANSCYDMIAFFSPSSVEALLKNFPDFKQKKLKIATFGQATAKAVRDAGLNLNVEAPLPNAPSMIGALELYIRKMNAVH